MAFVVALSLLVSAWVELISRRRLRPLLSRRCSGWHWHCCFPDASTADIRRFLTLFAACFGIPRKHVLAFRPDDQIMDIYDALYPPKWSIGDAMELEDLACEIEKNYGVRLNDVWHEGLSLGDLFNNVRLGCKERQ